jgi:hypothetical protein
VCACVCMYVEDREQLVGFIRCFPPWFWGISLVWKLVSRGHGWPQSDEDDPALYPQCSVSPVLHIPSALYPQCSISPVLRIPSAPYPQCSISPVLYIPSALYPQCSVSPVLYIPSALYPQCSISPVLYIPELAFLNLSFGIRIMSQPLHWTISSVPPDEKLSAIANTGYPKLQITSLLFLCLDIY